MKIPLIAPIAIVSLLFAACEQKSAQITSSSPPPSSARGRSRADPGLFRSDRLLLPQRHPQAAEAATSPSTSGTSNARPVFRNEDATQAANQYLDSYNAVLNDVTAVPGTRPAIPTDPQAAIEAADGSGAEGRARHSGRLRTSKNRLTGC